MESWGFQINPYDWCVANKTVDGKQCTVIWHVDIHEDPDVVTRFLDNLEDKYRKKADITIMQIV